LSPDQRKVISKTLVSLAQLLDKPLSPDSLTMMVNALSDLDYVRLKSCLENWVNRPNVKFPLPGDIRKELDPTSHVSERDVANELARKIDKAISKHGWAWDKGIVHETGNYFIGGGKSFWTFKEAVTEELGELGWVVIQNRGGWMHIVESSKDMEEQSFIAQLRDQIESAYRLQKSGVQVERIGLPNSQHNQIEPRVLKLIENTKGEQNGNKPKGTTDD
jgi:hypothetical protein